VDSGLSQTLKEVNLRALNNAECKLYYGPQVTYDMICMSGNYNEGTCIGDTGSPLLQMKDGEYMHVGIASFLSGNGCESTDPSGFTRTIHYIHWIRSIIGPV
jgi:secreted trypsin-like serine protease